MLNKTLGISTITFYLLIVVCLIFVETLNFIGLKNNNIDLFSFITILILVSILFLIFLIFSLKIKFNKYILFSLIFYILVLFCGVIQIFETKIDFNINGTIFVFDPSLINRLAWTIQWIVGISVVYLFLTIFLKNIHSVSMFKTILWIIVIFGLVSVFYSIFKESDCYLNIFTNAGLNTSPIKSFLNNENNFGQVLMIAIGALILIDSLRFKWWHYIIMAFLYFIMILTTCYIALAYTFFMFVIYTFYLFFKTMKKHKKLNILTLIITLSITAAIFLIFVLLDYFKNPIVNNLSKFLKGDLDNKNFLNLNGRIAVWQRALSTLNTPLEYLFGHGYFRFNQLIATLSLTLFNRPYTFVDSAYIQVLGSFGIVGLILYFSFTIFIFALGIYCYIKKRNKYVFTSLIILVTFFAYGFFETYVLFLPNLLGFASLFLIAMPIVVDFNKIIFKKQFDNELLAFKISINNKVIFPLLIFVFGLVFFGLTLIFNQKYFDINLYIFIILLVSFIPICYLIYNIKNKQLTIRWFMFALIYPLINFICLISIGTSLDESLKTFVIIFSCLNFIFIVLIMSVNKDYKPCYKFIFDFIKKHLLLFAIQLLIFIVVCYNLEHFLKPNPLGYSLLCLSFAYIFLLNAYLFKNTTYKNKTNPFVEFDKTFSNFNIANYLKEEKN